jgi:S-ribosylhomocysteine lyase
MADVNHRLVVPPYLREVTRKRLHRDVHAYLWDFRIGQPNVSQVSMPVLHTVEHFFGSHFRPHPNVLNVGVMGCQTGLYVNTLDLGKFDEVADLLVDVLYEVVSASQVPLADAVQCGWAENHSLPGAQEVARWALLHRDEWADAGTLSEELTDPADS